LGIKLQNIKPAVFSGNLQRAGFESFLVAERGFRPEQRHNWTRLWFLKAQLRRIKAEPGRIYSFTENRICHWFAPMEIQSHDQN